MTVSSEISRNDYDGDNTTDTFDFDFFIQQEGDLRVTKRETNDTETLLVLNTDYTVTGVEQSAGGSITLTAGNLQTDEHLTIRRVISPITQLTDLRNQGSFFAETHEDVFDRIIWILQDMQDRTDRALKLTETFAFGDFTLPVPTAGKGIGWNSSEDGFVNIEPGSIGTVTPGTNTVTNDSIGETINISNGGTGATSASAARTSLGLGTIATQNAASVAITGGSITGITDLAIADGGTGASTAAAAFANLKQAATTSATGVVELGTKAESEAAVDTTRVATIETMKNHPGVAKATLKFQPGASPIIDKSHNIDSVTQAASGLYDVTISDDLDGENYIVVAMSEQAATEDVRVHGLKSTTQVAGTFQIRIMNLSATLTDGVETVQIVVFGDLA